MTAIPNYQILEQLKENANYVIWRGLDSQLRPIISKVLKWEAITPSEKASFRNEYEILKILEGKPCIIQAYEFIDREDMFAIVLEDFGGKSIRSLISERKFTLTEILKIGIASATALTEIHLAGVIHKDINPANLVLNTLTGEIKLIDFGISERISLKSLSLQNPEKLEGTLAYISPEQTGRMNRNIDHRSDLYSLGIMMYELCCGNVPFQSNDPLELVHSHIASYPTDPDKVNSNLPHVLSEIIMKLLEKIGEARYQSALGLKFDLVKCLDSLLTKGIIEDFPLGEKDFSASFQIPQKLFGRQDDIVKLFNAYTNAFEGTKTTVLIEGHSGTGKSALVHELFKILKNFQGIKTYYISGKFDQFQKSIPYIAFNQAFNSYISFLLSEKKEFIASKKNEILKSLNGMGKILLEIIPDLELITGILEDVDKLDSYQTQNRLMYVLKNFLLAICNETNPLVIFLDDLQWADSGSLGLIKILINDADIKHLLFIGAYRNNVVSPAYPLSILIQESKEKNANIETISINNLKLQDIRSLVAETLNKKEEDINEIAELIFSKTSGNAFFVNQFFKSLYEKHLIYFDYNTGATPGWKWDFENILREKITDNVVLLMTEKILELPEDIRHALQLASCLGNRFSLRILSLILNKDRKESFTLLWEAIKENLLIPTGDYKVIQTSASNNDIPDSFDLVINFVHDRVQQSAYSLIEEEEKKFLHHQIGKIYSNQLSENERKEKIFEIIHHLNYGSSLLETELEKLELVKLNLEIGKRAKLSCAYEAALSYFEIGLELFNQLINKKENKILLLALYTEACETSWLLGSIEKMNFFTKEALSIAESSLQKVRIYKILITYNASTGNGIKAIQNAVEILKELGIKIDSFPSQLAVVRELLKVKIALALKKISSLSDMPALENEKLLCIMELLSATNSPAYSVSPNLLPILIFKQVRITAKHGITSASSYAYCTLGVIHCGVLNDINSGYDFGNLALKLINKNSSPEFNAKTIIVYNGFIRFWKESITNTLIPLKDGYKASLESGDFEYAGIASYLYSLHSLLSGKELISLEKEMEIYNGILEKLNQSERLPYHKMFYQLLHNFQGKVEKPESLKGEIYDIEKSLPIHLARKDRTSIFTVNLICGILEFHFGKLEGSVKYFEETMKDEDAVVGSPNIPLLLFYQSLANIRYAKEKPFFLNRTILRKIKKNQKRMLFWSKHCKANFLHKYYLVEAEFAGLLKKNDEAKKYYDLAILTAREFEYIQEEALSWELAGRFFIGTNDILAELYLLKAYACYTKWGGFAKIKSLENLYPSYIRGLKYSQTLRETIHLTKKHSTLMTTSSTTRMDNLDLNSILKASQTISSEIDLSKLISNLMKLMAENAGAEKGYLIMEEDGVYWIEAGYGMDNTYFTRSNLNEYENISSSIVNYVINSKLSVVLDNAFEQSTHTDSYIANNKIKSILCLPLLNRGEMSGILYLENNLLTGAFTEQSLNLLKLLSSQAAISIQNARFYKHLKQVNQAYERFVPKEFLQLLEKKSILDVELGQFTQKKMTVLFCDIRDFTTLSEEMSPEENFRFINSFLRRMEPAISKNKGFIDKYIGDAIMALFSEKADDALLAAIEMRANLHTYNLHRENSDYPAIRIGIGINTGDLMLGTIGGSSRMDGTVISDAVNLAARIESLTKTFHTPILVSEYLVDKLENKNQFYLREVDIVKVKGKEKSVTIYECFNCDKQEIIDKKLESLENYYRGLKAFRKGNILDARFLFNLCQANCPEDPLPVIYINRCNKIISEKGNQVQGGIYLFDESKKERNILIVDNNKEFLDSIGNLFSKNKYEVILSENEKDAIQKYESFRPNIILTELHLSGGSGFSIIQSIRRAALRYHKKPIIVLITEEESGNTEETAIQMGADFFFKKSIPFEELLKKLKKL